MATLTAFGLSGDGHANSQNATYSTARAGSSLTAANAPMYVGQLKPGDYNCLEGFIAFDTSSIPDGATITQVELSLYLTSDVSDTDFTVQVHPKTWTPSGLTTADYVPGADIAALTLLATLNSSGIGATGAYKTFTENGTNFRSAINKTGNTELLLASSRHSSGNTPTGNEYLTFASEASFAGTATDPKLVVTYTEPTSGTGALTIPAQQLAASGKQVASGTGALALAPAVLAGDGAHTDVQGTGALGLWVPALEGSSLTLGAGAFSVAFPTLAATGWLIPAGDGALTLWLPSVAGEYVEPYRPYVMMRGAVVFTRGTRMAGPIVT